MIFGKYYDKSLWIMTAGKRKDEILDFIENIPEEFIGQIQKALILYQHCFVRKKNTLDVEKINLTGELITSGDMVYWYSVDKETGALDMGEYIQDGEDRYSTFQMTLHPLKRRHYESMESFDERLLGDISYNYAEQYYAEDLVAVESDTIEYSLIKFPLGIMMVCSSETWCYDRRPNAGKNRYNFVNMKSVPGNYNVRDLRNRLVRRRKKTNDSK